MKFRRKTQRRFHRLFSDGTLSWEADINDEGIATPVGLDAYLVQYGLLHALVLKEYQKASNKLKEICFVSVLIDSFDKFEDAYLYWRFFGNLQIYSSEYAAQVQHLLHDPSPGHVWVADKITEFCQDIGWMETALAISLDIIKQCTKTFGPLNPYIIMKQCHAAQCLNLLYKHSEALKLTTALLSKVKDEHGSSSDVYLYLLSTQASLLQRNRKPTEALTHFLEAQGEYEALYGNSSEEALKACINTAICYGDLCRWETALSLFSRVREGIKDNPILADKIGLKVEKLYAEFLAKMRMEEQALEVYSNIYEKTIHIYGVEHPNTISMLYDYLSILIENRSIDKIAQIKLLLEDCLNKNKILNPGLVLKVRYSLCMILLSKKAWHEAEETLLALLDDCLTHHGKEHPLSLNVMRATAQVLNHLESPEDAVRLFEHVWNREKDSLPTGGLAYLAFEYGHTLHKLNNLEEAERLLKRSIEIFTAVHSQMHPVLVDPVDELGRVLLARDSVNEAFELLMKSLHISELGHGPNDPRSLLLRGSVARCYSNKGLFNQALELIQPLREQTIQDPSDYSSLLLDIATIDFEAGHIERAKTTAQHSLNIASAELGDEHSYTIDMIFLLYKVLGAEEDWSAAEALLIRGLKAATSYFGPIHFVTSRIIDELWWSKQKQDKWKDIVQLYSDVLPAYIEHYDSTHSWVCTATINISDAHLKLGEASIGEQLLTDLIQICVDQNQDKKAWVLSYRLLSQKRKLGTASEKDTHRLYRSAINIYGKDSKQALTINKWLEEL